MLLVYHPMDLDQVSRPHSRSSKWALVAALLAVVSLLQAVQLEDLTAFTAASAFGPSRPSSILAPKADSSVRLWAQADDNIIDAEEVEGSGEDEEFAEEEEALVSQEGYDDSAKADYAYNEVPSPSFFKRRKIDRHKVNMVFFDMFKKPKNFFPHQLQPGDTVRVSYLQAKRQAPEKQDGAVTDYKFTREQLQETTFQGTILQIRGQYQARSMTLRTMKGSGVNLVGVEMNFPIHSPMVTKIQVLRRGYIGNNKNAYFMRGMIGARNQIPVDVPRSEMDKQYMQLRLLNRADEIPESDYPKLEWDRYPWPIWRQDKGDWDESKYDPAKHVDTRTEFERRIIGQYRMKPSRTGRYGNKQR
jgi:large subunit ribosomal protein L19